MVPSWRSSVYLGSVGYGPGHGPRPRFPLLRPLKEEVRSELNVGMLCIFLHHHLPVVFLGLLSGFLQHCHQWFHWGLDAFWIDGHPGLAESGIAIDP